jgi:acyl-coenzyme A synthetase/AMP-(fatty) acid ligase
MPAIPLLAHARRDAVVARRGAAPVSVARFLADVAQTAARLPPGEHVMNLCGDRYRFAVALAAALCRGRVSLLPPSAASEVLRRIAQRYRDAGALVDPGAQFPGVGPTVAVEATGSPGDGAIPAVDSDRLAVIAFTSGSTGEAMPQPKTWGSLARGAAAEAAGLGLESGGRITLLGTVPPQHMYGLESTVVLALCGGFALHAGRPLYPADVAGALAEAPGDRVLVTTPVHLRALLAAGITLPALRLIVCATAPLGRDLAAQAESRYAAPLREIYGFTEAGMVATRRTAREDRWHTLADVRLRCVDGQVRFCGGHIDNEVAANDVLEPVDPQTFMLHGRGADLVNVAGKRTSLAHLDHELTSVDGVEDGAFFLPDAAERGVTRPMAFVVAPSLSRETLLTALRARLDAVFLPRPLHFVRALPRNATGKLPREALAALAADCAARPTAAAAVRLIGAEHPAVQGHFPGNPVVPGAMILDRVIRVAEARLGLPAGAWTVSAAKFLAPARPGEDLRIELAGGSGMEIRFACFIGARAVASGALRRLGDPAQGPAGAGR